jgi:cyclopropane-fatty-acyl-phospholipid synthase
MGITLSHEPRVYAARRVAALGLQDRIESTLCDCRDLEGRFRKVAARGMIPHLGHRYFRRFLQGLEDLLEPEGVAVLDSVMAFDGEFTAARRNPS